MFHELTPEEVSKYQQRGERVEFVADLEITFQHGGSVTSEHKYYKYDNNSEINLGAAVININKVEAERVTLEVRLPWLELGTASADEDETKSETEAKTKSQEVVLELGEEKTLTIGDVLAFQIKCRIKLTGVHAGVILEL